MIDLTALKRLASAVQVRPWPPHLSFLQIQTSLPIARLICSKPRRVSPVESNWSPNLNEAVFAVALVAMPLVWLEDAR